MTAAAGSSSTTSPTSDPHASPRTGSTLIEGGSSRHKAPRSLPPWIDSYEARYGRPTDDQFKILHSPPPPVQTPQHNNTPAPPQRRPRRVSIDGYITWEDDSARLSEAPKQTLHDILTRRRGAVRGRKWDHLRTAEPVVVSSARAAAASARNGYGAESQWQAFVQSSEYGHLPGEDSEVVDPEVLDKLQPGFNVPMAIPRPTSSSPGRRRRTAALYKRVWRLIIQHPLVPLMFRMVVLLTSIIALALSARILMAEIAHQEYYTSERAQAIMALVVDGLAIPYIGYMTWDEYTGKPLGLRRATHKISLVLMDLFFIILKSSSTTLAFESLVYHNYAQDVVRQYSQALAAFQMIGLISWTLTLAVNVFRLVHRMGGGDEESDSKQVRGGHG